MFIFRNIRFILDYFVESVSSERHISMACSCITFTLHETSKPPAWVSGVSPALFDTDLPDIYVVDKILDSGIKGGEIEYKAKWKAYTMRETTWEPQGHAPT